MRYLLTLLALFVFATTSFAASIEVLFDFSPSDPIYEASAYNLYANGELFGTAQVADTNMVDGLYQMTIVRLLESGSVDFHMTAVYVSGNESPASNVVTMTIPPDQIGPMIQSIKVILDNGEELIFVLQP